MSRIERMLTVLPNSVCTFLCYLLLLVFTVHADSFQSYVGSSRIAVKKTYFFSLFLEVRNWASDDDENRILGLMYIVRELRFTEDMV